jgi:hypothetical protein
VRGQGGEGSTAPLDLLGRGKLELELWEMEAAEGCEVAEGWEAGGMVERDGPGWDGRIKERNRKKKKNKKNRLPCGTHVSEEE